MRSLLEKTVILVVAAFFIPVSVPNAMASEAIVTIAQGTEGINASGTVTDFAISKNITAGAKFEGFYVDGNVGGTIGVQSEINLGGGTELNLDGNYAINTDNDGLTLKLGFNAPETKFGTIQLGTEYQHNTLGVSVTATEVPLAFDGKGAAAIMLTLDDFRPTSAQVQVSGKWDRFELEANIMPDFGDFQNTQFNISGKFSW